MLVVDDETRDGLPRRKLQVPNPSIRGHLGKRKRPLASTSELLGPVGVEVDVLLIVGGVCDEKLTGGRIEAEDASGVPLPVEVPEDSHDVAREAPVTDELRRRN